MFVLCCAMPKPIPVLVIGALVESSRTHFGLIRLKVQENKKDTFVPTSLFVVLFCIVFQRSDSSMFLVFFQKSSLHTKKKKNSEPFFHSINGCHFYVLLKHRIRLFCWLQLNVLNDCKHDL